MMIMIKKLEMDIFLLLSDGETHLDPSLVTWSFLPTIPFLRHTVDFYNEREALECAADEIECFVAASKSDKTACQQNKLQPD